MICIKFVNTKNKILSTSISGTHKKRGEKIFKKNGQQQEVLNNQIIKANRFKGFTWKSIQEVYYF